MIQIDRPGRFLVFCLGVVLLIGGAVLWLAWGSSRIQKTGDFTIENGQSARTIWHNLVKEKYSVHTLPWRYYAWKMGAGSKIKAGAYHLETGDAIRDVVARFATGQVISNETTMTFPEGFTLEQYAERLNAAGLISKEDFMAAAKPTPDLVKTYPYLSALKNNRTVEGYLFPDTYKISKDDTASDIVRRMLGNFDQKLTPEIRDEVSKSGHTLDEIMIMASILEREGVKPEDLPTIAGVFWNRIDQQIGLGSDATVRYALDKWDKELTVDDLATDSPYNTRKYRGLTPGPISNPGLTAILAAIHPTKSDYLYYLTGADGTTYFAKTLEQHVANKNKYLK
jgi:UPF0755 protein